MPTLTLAIPTYDRPGGKELFAACLACLEHQTLRPDEVMILGDDGPNNMGTKRNKALDECRTDFLAWFDDDDIYGTGYLEELMAFLETERVPTVTMGLDPLIYDAEIGAYRRFGWVTGAVAAYEMDFVRHFGLRYQEQALPLWKREGKRMVKSGQSHFDETAWFHNQNRFLDLPFTGLRDFSSREDYLFMRYPQASYHGRPADHYRKFGTWISDQNRMFLRRIAGDRVRELVQAASQAISGRE